MTLIVTKLDGSLDTFKNVVSIKKHDQIPRTIELVKTEGISEVQVHNVLLFQVVV